MIIPQVAAVSIYLVTAIELQRQRIVAGKPTWRFSLTGMLWVTLFVAVLLAAALHIAHSTQREFASGQRVVESIQAITKSGKCILSCER